MARTRIAVQEIWNLGRANWRIGRAVIIDGHGKRSSL